MEERYQKMVASTTVQVVVLGVGATSYGTIMIPEYICTVVPIQTYRQAIITLQALQIVCISVQWTSRSHTHGLPDRADLESGRFVCIPLYDVETHRENHAISYAHGVSCLFKVKLVLQYSTLPLAKFTTDDRDDCSTKVHDMLITPLAPVEQKIHHLPPPSSSCTLDPTTYS